MLSLFNGHELQGFVAWDVGKIIQVKADLMGPSKSQGGMGEEDVIETLDSIVTEPPCLLLGWKYAIIPEYQLL